MINFYIAVGAILLALGLTYAVLCVTPEGGPTLYYNDEEFHDQDMTPDEIMAAADEQEQHEWDRVEVASLRAEPIMMHLAHFFAEQGVTLYYDPAYQCIRHRQGNLIALDSDVHIDLRGM